MFHKEMSIELVFLSFKPVTELHKCADIRVPIINKGFSVPSDIILYEMNKAEHKILMTCACDSIPLCSINITRRERNDSNFFGFAKWTSIKFLIGC